MNVHAIHQGHLVVRETFDAAALVAEFPARFTNANKKYVQSIVSSRTGAPKGTVHYSRWRAMPLPDAIPGKAPELEAREDVFGYEPTPDGVMEWHVNFADPHLFVAYGGSLLAQDELQVLEHPALGSLCEALRARQDPRYRPVTTEAGVCTPVLVRGVERRCAFATDPDLEAGRPLGLYGNRFARAKSDEIDRALTVLSPPTTSNILAMAAPPGGFGLYSEAEIHSILTTAFTGFIAARIDSTAEATATRTVVHTGHWGTGAFGGHKVLMAILQILAARLAGVDRLVYHTFDAAGSEPYREAARFVERKVPVGGVSATRDILGEVHAMGFAWGVSDGN